MVKWKVIGVAVLITATFGAFFAFFQPLVSSIFGVGISLSPLSFALLIGFAISLAFSGFLPYNWGKILREFSLFLLFAFLLLFEMTILSPYLKKVGAGTDISIDKCEGVGSFVPSKEQTEGGNLFFNVLKFTSCVITGYAPSGGGDVGWTAFSIFYLILPFAFILTLIYGIMKGVFGSGVGTQGPFEYLSKFTPLLSFIIAMYAARTMLGGFLLEFAGYGAWGLAAVFLAIFFTRGLGHMMDNWYQAEQMAQTTRDVIKSEIETERAFAISVEPLLNRVKQLGNERTTLMAAKNMLGTIKNTPIWNMLSNDARNMIDWFISKAIAANTPDTFLNYVNELEKYLKTAMKYKSS